MLTERGWAASGVTTALVVLWVVLGEIEFLVERLEKGTAARPLRVVGCRILSRSR